jgi:hypothetical protein
VVCLAACWASEAPKETVAFRWILYTWDAEIPCIIELPLGLSVAKAGAGAKNGILYRDARFFLPNSGAMVFPR